MSFRALTLRRGGSLPDTPPAPAITVPPQLSGLVGLYWHGYGATVDGSNNLVSWAPSYWDTALSGPVNLTPSGVVPWSNGAAWPGGSSGLQLTLPYGSTLGGRTGWGTAHRTSRAATGSIPFPANGGQPYRTMAVYSYNLPPAAPGGYGVGFWYEGADQGAFNVLENWPGGAAASRGGSIADVFSQAGPTTEVHGWQSGTSYISYRDPGVAPYDSFASGTVTTCDQYAGGVFVVGGTTQSHRAGSKTTVVAVWMTSIATNIAAIADYIRDLP